MEIFNDSPNWRNRINLIFVSLGIILLPVMAHAGGLGIAPIAAIVGGVGILTTPFRNFLTKPPLWMIALFVFMIWAVTSSFWSDYEDPQILSNPLKWFIGVPLFLGSFLAVKSASQYHRSFLSHLLMAACVLGIGLLLIDLLSGYGLTNFLDPQKTEDAHARKQGDVRQALGHSITVWLLLLVPVMVLMARALAYGRLCAALIVFGLFAASFIHELAVGVLGLVMLGLAYCFGRRFPKSSTSGLIYVSIGSLVFAPVLGLILNQLPVQFIERLPLSWYHRVEMWSYTTKKIWDTPFWGHGFDAARTFKGDAHKFEILDGLYWHYITLHPHNFGLHLWLETGLIGAVLAGILLYFLKKPTLELSNSSDLRLCIITYIAAALFICSTTYGVWQDWWWATLIFCAALIQIIPKNE